MKWRPKQERGDRRIDCCRKQLTDRQRERGRDGNRMGAMTKVIETSVSILFTKDLYPKKMLQEVKV